MKSILFVCHGNICRSTMAQGVMQHLIDVSEVGDLLRCDSAGTSAEELGNPVDPRTVATLRAHSIEPVPHTARQISRKEYGDWDYFVGMDSLNRKNLHRLFMGDVDNKVSLLLDWTQERSSIEDPWYTGDFEGVYEQISRGCKALLENVLKGEN